MTGLGGLTHLVRSNFTQALVILPNREPSGSDGRNKSGTCAKIVARHT